MNIVEKIKNVYYLTEVEYTGDNLSTYTSGERIVEFNGFYAVQNHNYEVMTIEDSFQKAKNFLEKEIEIDYYIDFNIEGLNDYFYDKYENSIAPDNFGDLIEEYEAQYRVMAEVVKNIEDYYEVFKDYKGKAISKPAKDAMYHLKENFKMGDSSCLAANLNKIRPYLKKYYPEVHTYIAENFGTPSDYRSFRARFFQGCS